MELPVLKLSVSEYNILFACNTTGAMKIDTNIGTGVSIQELPSSGLNEIDSCIEILGRSIYGVAETSTYPERSNILSKADSKSALSNLELEMEVLSISVNVEQVKNILIQDFATKRVGYRLQRRVSDTEGNCSNTVETEKIITIGQNEDQIYSYLQIRGSVPLPWCQIPNIKYQPSVQFTQNIYDLTEIAKKSIRKQHLDFGDISYINLLDNR
ncbi:MAG: hypothetical protein EZS28_028647 [Streblomastix strix]|uniref:SAC domain-containing protein n=1 Tax=Streblomastix strix TaxID=222440 RepID=A0A5J4UYQ7_9EUKA|nr:MAG: hypothetical protein EZS28_028647 [Streblomastix strix]